MAPAPQDPKLFALFETIVFLDKQVSTAHSWIERGSTISSERTESFLSHKLQGYFCDICMFFKKTKNFDLKNMFEELVAFGDQGWNEATF